jgi:cell wall-associated NlpC family hydrolase
VTLTAPRRPVRTAVVGLTSVSVALFGVVAVGVPASADPDLDDVRERVSDVSDKVDDLYHEAEIANERYLKAEQEYEDTLAELRASKKAAKKQATKLQEMTSDMGGFAAAAYRQGLVDPTLHMVLSDNPSDALAESMMLDAYADQQASALAVVATERAALSQKQADVQEEAALLEVIGEQMADQQQTLESRVDEAESLLASLKEQEREILAEIEAQRQREAEQRAEAAARAARDAERQATTGAAAAAPAPEAKPAPTPAAPPASGRGAAAVRFAMAQIGDAYVYGGTGPNGWDCSGLTSGAWRAAGVSIPRTSQAQLAGLPRVSVSNVRPGDIIVYYSGASHVGIYIGNGKIVHASRPGVPVGVAPMHSMPVIGAVRPG